MAEELEKRREKARNLRYKKPLVRGLNLEDIQSELYEISADCDEVPYFVRSDDEDLLADLIGSEDEAYEFRMLFADLSASCERLRDDLDYSGNVPEYFDIWFAAFQSATGGEVLGFEEDYYRLDGYEIKLAQDEAVRQLKRMTKDEIIRNMSDCLTVFVNYTALKYRYDCLEASMDIIRGRNREQLETAKRINALFDEAQDDDFWKDPKIDRQFRKLLGILPQEVWTY